MRNPIKCLEAPSDTSSQEKAKEPFEYTDAITLRTNIAQQFIDNGWQTRRLGLMQYDILVRRVWYAAKADDPYADWTLLKTYDAFQKGRVEFQKIKQHCLNSLDTLSAFEVAIYKHEHLKKYELSFATPYGNMGAVLLSDFDSTICHLLTVKRLGLAIQLKKFTQNHCIHTLQTLFETPRTWRRLPLTRADIRQKTALAEQAQARWGKCPQGIFARTLKFAYWPRRNGVPESSSHQNSNNTHFSNSKEITHDSTNN